MNLPTNDVIKLLQMQNVSFEIFRFDYIPGGGTGRSSSELGIPEHSVVKSLIFKVPNEGPILALMHGDGRVDTKKLASCIGAERIKSCSPEEAELWSGWQVGSTNPFKLKNPMKIVLQQTILSLDRIWINGGGRGLLVALNPQDLSKLIDYIPADFRQ